jgi:hypothetical protein
MAPFQEDSVMRRASLALATVLVVCLAVPAMAQTARATGTVKDTGGKAMKGATIKASNKDAYPSQITSSTDDKGRWAMIGLRTGTWTFVAEAPGFTPQQAQWPVRVAGTPPMHFVLARDLGPIPGALSKNVQQQLTAANALRDRFAIKTRNSPPSTSSSAASIARRPRSRAIPLRDGRCSIARLRPTQPC